MSDKVCHLSDNRQIAVADNMGKGLFDFEVYEVIGSCILCDTDLIHSLLPQVQDINPISDEVVEIRLTMSPDLLRSFVSILVAPSKCLSILGRLGVISR